MKKSTTTAVLAFTLLPLLGWGTSIAVADSTSSPSLENELALERGTQAVIWGLPAVSMKFFFEGMQAIGCGGEGMIWQLSSANNFELIYEPGIKK